MDHANPPDERLAEILTEAKTIAVVGLSPDPAKTSYIIGRYLQQRRYKIVPVNPKADEVLGEKAYADTTSVPGPVDIVDVFRRAEYAPAIVEEAAEVGAPVVWFQLGIESNEAAVRGRELGIEVVMDR